MERILQIPIFIAIFLIAYIHADRFNRNIPIGPAFHFMWGAAYAILAGFIAWRYHSWMLLIAFAFERFVLYNPLLNYQRTPQKSFFYLGTSPINRSWWDDLELIWAKAYPWIWGTGLLGWIIVNFLSW